MGIASRKYFLNKVSIVGFKYDCLKYKQLHKFETCWMEWQKENRGRSKVKIEAIHIRTECMKQRNNSGFI